MSDDLNDKFSKVDVFFEMFEEMLERQNRYVKRLIEKELEELKQTFSDQHPLREVVVPAIDERIIKIKAELNDISGDTIVKAIRKQIKESQSDMIDALFPIIGKLIKKYISVEMERLSENINQQIDNTFSFASIKREFLSLFGIQEKDQLLKQAIAPTIEEVYVIYQDSGLLLGQYTLTDITDHDLIAGMLTAIKSFVKDTFQQEGETGDLDTIEYGNFKIILT
ncbi:MAG: hypothetical protein AAF734_05330, partial [Bacteroidota bacterium]